MTVEGLKFCAFVRRKREAREIGLREMAKKIGVSPTYLSKVERNGGCLASAPTASRPSAPQSRASALSVRSRRGEASAAITREDGPRRSASSSDFPPGAAQASSTDRPEAASRATSCDDRSWT